MLTYVLDVGDLADARFVLSPLNETVLSLFHVNKVHRSAAHLDGWRRQAHAASDRYDRALIDALVSPAQTTIPDFLTPITALRDTRPTFSEHLKLVAATDPELARAEFVELAEGADPSPALARLIDDDDPARLAADALDVYHRVVIAPVWRSIERILEADITYRGRELAAGGPGRLFESLTPHVEWIRSGELRVDLQCTNASGEYSSGGRGLTLLPSVFVGGVTAAHDPVRVAPHIGYAARGSATFAESVPPVAADALRRLIGTAKADLLTAMDEPAAVVDLARALRVSPSAISQSLKVLAANGVVESSRYGRRVLYRRTALGDALAEQRQYGTV